MGTSLRADTMNPMKAPVRIVTLLVAATVWLFATVATAAADSPASSDWPAAPERSVLDTALLFGGSTVGLFVLVWLFGLLTARNNYVPPAPSTELETTSGNAPVHH